MENSVKFTPFCASISILPITMWNAQLTRRFVKSNDDRINDIRIYSVAYGIDKSGKTPKDAKCFMREDTIRRLRDGTFLLLPCDNEHGFTIVDKITKLSAPQLNIGGKIIF